MDFRFATSQRMIDLSSDPVATMLPSGLNASGRDVLAMAGERLCDHPMRAKVIEDKIPILRNREERIVWTECEVGPWDRISD